MKILTLDLETTGLDWTRDRILLVGYRVNGGPVIQFVPTTIPTRLISRAIVGPMIPKEEIDFMLLLKDPNVLKRGHNIKFDILFLINNWYEFKGPLDDTAILSYLENPFSSCSLKYLVENKLHKKVTHIEELLEQTKITKGLKKNRIVPFDQIDMDLWKPYNADDVINCDLLRENTVETQWYRDVEQPLINILTKMEHRGILLDTQHLSDLKNEYETRISVEEHELGGINARSAKQVAELLNSTGVALKEKTKKGKPKADKLVLKKLAWEGNETAKHLLSHRELSKLKSTYILPLLQQSDFAGRIHGSFNQAGSEGGTGGTKTGRLTSSGPNLQNIPDRTEEGRKIRKAFIPTPGTIMVDSDLKQIEPRLVAHFTQNKFLLEAYEKGLDTHAIMGGIVFGKDPKTLTKMERFIGKTCWLADFYGCSAKKLKVICETSSAEELPYDEDYFKTVKKGLEKGNPQLYAWRRSHVEMVRKLGFVTTIGGRQINIPNLSARVPYERFAAEREAVNYLIQGSAADIMKMILVKLDKDLPWLNLLATVHDEILAEFDPKHPDLDNDFVDPLLDIKVIMCNTVLLNNVNIESDTKIIKNWSEK